MLRDGRCKPRCPNCRVPLKEIRAGKIAVYDLPEPDLDTLEILLVDEKSVRKGYGYVTVVLNGLTGELLHMAEGKKKESLESFFSDKQKASIRAVCSDRNGAYRFVLREKLPGAEVVHDRFHITAFFKHRITSGKIESFNNQIARLIHLASGMTNLRHLFLKMRAQSIKQI